MLFTSIEVPNNADINEIRECYIPSNLDATFANANSFNSIVAAEDNDLKSALVSNWMWLNQSRCNCLLR